MGHSKSAPSVASNKNFRPNLSREEAVTEHARVLKAKNAVQTVDYACQYILPALPDGAAKVPVYYTVRYGAQFLWDTYKHDISYAAKNFTKTFVVEQVIPQVSSAIWGQIEDRVLKSEASKALAKPAEEAFNEVLTRIAIKGVDAL